MTKQVCSDYKCNWHGTSEEVLMAPNPFDPSDEILGCPKCKQVNTVQVACDEPDCWEPVTMGTPTPTGYRQTCGRHRP